MMRKCLILLIGGGLIISAALPAMEANAASKARNVNQLSKQIEDNITSFKRDFTIEYTGNTAVYNNNVVDGFPAAVSNSVHVKDLLENYSYSTIARNGKIETTFKVNYRLSRAKAKKAEALLNKEVKKIKKTAKTDFAKIKAVNDYVVKNTVYGGSTMEKYTTFGVLNNGVAVCQGYTLVTHKMLKKLDIPVIYVSGNVKQENHAWNKVKLQGKWYNLDTTWNDPSSNAPNEVRYNYFLVSDKQLAKDHRWNKKNYPAAKSTKYDVLADESASVLVGNTFYYASKKNREKLYSFNIKTNKHKKVSNTRVQDLTYRKGKLYFSNYSNSAYIYSMKTNGKSLKKLKSMRASKLHIKGTYLHFQSNKKHYKMKI